MAPHMGVRPAIFAVAALCHGAQGVALHAADLGTIESKRRIRVLVAANEDPELFSPARSETPGFEREILEGWARRLEARVEVVPVRTHAELLTGLTRNRGDLAVGVPRTAPAREAAAFATALWPRTQVVVSRKPTPAPATAEELNRVVLGLVDGSTAARSVAEVGVPMSRVLRFPTRQRILDSLRSGDLHAVVVPLWVFVSERRRDDALSAGLVLGGSSWAVDKGSVHLLHALNRHIEQVRGAPEWGELGARYFGPESVALMDPVTVTAR